MLLFVILAVFIAGLMVGRTPEYLGKKIEAREVKMAMLAILILPLSILGFTAAAAVIPSAVASTANPGPHGFSEILYAYTSQTGNNGSAFAGLTGNTMWYNVTGGIAMLVGRYFVIIPMMAIAGSLVAKKTVPASAGTFPTHGLLFIGLLVGVILIIGALRKRMPASALLDWKIVWPAIGASFRKLDSRALMANPVMFVVEMLAALATFLLARDLWSGQTMSLSRYKS